jgi:hypothetical protein
MINQSLSRPQVQRTARRMSTPPDELGERTKTGSLDCNNRIGDTGADNTPSLIGPGVIRPRPACHHAATLDRTAARVETESRHRRRGPTIR